MSDELKQFVALTSGTSSGFAKVMSTHCMNCKIEFFLSYIGFSSRTYIEQCRAVHGSFDHLNGRVIAHVHSCVRW
jgi:hypothetical protein